MGQKLYNLRIFWRKAIGFVVIVSAAFAPGQALVEVSAKKKLHCPEKMQLLKKLEQCRHSQIKIKVLPLIGSMTNQANSESSCSLKRKILKWVQRCSAISEKKDTAGEAISSHQQERLYATLMARIDRTLARRHASSKKNPQKTTHQRIPEDINQRLQAYVQRMNDSELKRLAIWTIKEIERLPQNAVGNKKLYKYSLYQMLTISNLESHGKDARKRAIRSLALKMKGVSGQIQANLKQSRKDRRQWHKQKRFCLEIETSSWQKKLIEQNISCVQNLYRQVRTKNFVQAYRQTGSSMTVEKVFLLRYGNALQRICRRIQQRGPSAPPQEQNSKAEDPLVKKLERLYMHCQQAREGY